MKTKSVFFALFISLILLQSCSESKFDYRHKYVGDFNVTGTMDYTGAFDEPQPIASTATVTFADESEAVDVDVVDLAIHVVATIDKNGKLSASTGAALGQFSDKDHFDMALSGGTPVGGSYAWTLHGVRKKNP